MRGSVKVSAGSDARTTLAFETDFPQLESDRAYRCKQSKHPIPSLSSSKQIPECARSILLCSLPQTLGEQPTCHFRVAFDFE